MAKSISGELFLRSLPNFGSNFENWKLLQPIIPFDTWRNEGQFKRSKNWYLMVIIIIIMMTHVPLTYMDWRDYAGAIVFIF